MENEMSEVVQLEQNKEKNKEENLKKTNNINKEESSSNVMDDIINISNSGLELTVSLFKIIDL